MVFLSEVERCENIMLTLVKRSRNDSIPRIQHVLERSYNMTTKVVNIVIQI